MSEPKWTPGPWVRDGETTSETIWAGCAPSGYGSTGRYIASVHGDDAEAEDNAHLIAAAPDLYAALEMAQLWLDVDGRFDMQGINAALAKARGEA